MNIALSEEKLRQNVSELTIFIPTFTREDFISSRELPARQDQDGYWTPAWTVLEPEASRFLSVCRNSGFINPHWMNTSVVSDDRSHKLRNGSIALDRITLVDVAHLLTFLSRQERFANGALAQAFDDGTIITLLNRLASIAQ